MVLSQRLTYEGPRQTHTIKETTSRYNQPWINTKLKGLPDARRSHTNNEQPLKPITQLNSTSNSSDQWNQQQKSIQRISA